MFPLIPAILLLLLQGSSGFERFPQDTRLPQPWNALHRDARVRDVRAEAALVRFLALAASQQIIASGSNSAQPRSNPELISVALVAPALKASPEDGYQDCRRSRDGPSSIG
jgi:hypothetical protein